MNATLGRSMVGSNPSSVRLLMGPGVRQILAVLPAFLVYPLVARYLSDAELGIWTLIGAAGFSLVLMDLGLSTAVRRSAVTDDDPRTRRLVALTLFVVVALLPAAAAIYWFVLLDFSDASPTLKVEGYRASWVMFVGALAGAWATPFRDYNYAKGASDLVAKTRVVGSMTRLIVAAVGFAMGFGIVVPAVGATLGNMLVLGMLIRHARRIDRQLPLIPDYRSPWPEVKSAFRDGVAALVIHVAVVMALRVDYWVLKWSEKDRALGEGLSPTEASERALSSVGRYGLAGLAVGQAYLVAKQSINVLMQRLGRREQRAEALRVGTTLFAGIIFCGVTAIVVTGQPFLVLVLGNKAAGEHVLIILFLLGLASMVMSTYQVASDMVMIGGRTAWSCAIPIAAGSVVNLVISVAGAQTFGVWAVAGSTLVGNLVTAVLMWRVATRTMDWSARDAMATTIPVATAFGPALLLAVLLRSWSAQDAWHSLGASIIVFAIGVACLALCARWLWRTK